VADSASDRVTDTLGADATGGSAAEEPRGRLFLVTAQSEEQAAAVGSAVAARLSRCVLVRGSTVDDMVVSGRAVGTSHLERTHHLLLRWSACLALAETYLLEGYDAVVADAVTGPHVEDFLDLAAPETVHLLVVDDAESSTTPRWGLWLSPGVDAEEAAGALLGRLEDAAVLTADPGDVGTADS